MVGADAFAAAVSGEFGGDGEGAGFEFFDGVAVALDEVEGGGVAAGEVGEGGAAVGAAGADGDADAGDLGVDFEVGFAADGDAGGVGGAVGDCGPGVLGGFVGEVIRPTLSPAARFRAVPVIRSKPAGAVAVRHERVRIYARICVCCRPFPEELPVMAFDRRKFLKKSAVTGAGVALAGAAAAPSAQAAEAAVAKGGRKPKRYSLTVMGTTDLHGHVFNWDYFTDAEYDDAADNAQGLAQISTLVNAVRKEKGRRNTLLIDAGDTIQGTHLTYYYAKVDPITGQGWSGASDGAGDERDRV